MGKNVKEEQERRALMGRIRRLKCKVAIKKVGSKQVISDRCVSGIKMSLRRNVMSLDQTCVLSPLLSIAGTGVF